MLKPFPHRDDLLKFLPFQGLDSIIKKTVLKLFDDDRLNKKGGLKRPPNCFFVFRSEYNNRHGRKGKPQSELSTQCRAEYRSLSLDQHTELEERTAAIAEELRRFFPSYSYRPMSKREEERYARLGPDQKREFWLAAVVRIAERIADPKGSWKGFLTLGEWEDEQKLSYVSPHCVAT